MKFKQLHILNIECSTCNLFGHTKIKIILKTQTSKKKISHISFFMLRKKEETPLKSHNLHAFKKRKLLIIIFIKKSQQLEMDTEKSFETLSVLPVAMFRSQCVVDQHELLICGGAFERACYSYHIQKKQYKLICSYPSEVRLYGHSVVKLAIRSNEKGITLLSFGGEYKHTLVMNYVSVWDGDEDGAESKNERSKEKEKEKPEQMHDKLYNEWMALADNTNRAVCIGREKDDYNGVRAVIGGSNNHLLFITYRPNNMDVFDLDALQYVSHHTLPTDANIISCHCFVSTTLESGVTSIIEQKQSLQKGKELSQMILFCCKIGLSIHYDETNHSLKCKSLTMCKDVEPLNHYAYVYVHGAILLFGGHDSEKHVSKAIFKYSIRDDHWTKCERHTLPLSLYASVA
ncbi:hypothetical protein RFI_01622, partial [Reticulomyxa filosa]